MIEAGVDSYKNPFEFLNWGLAPSVGMKIKHLTKLMPCVPLTSSL